jgi:lipopolysaccharide transport system permease protein
MRIFNSFLRFLQAPWVSLWINRELLYQLCKRDISAKYKTSALGLAWSVLLPLTMLAIYAFVFGEIFKSRWGNAPPPQTWSERLSFALILYAGLITFNWFAECLSKSPTTILHHVNFVKRVIFPLDILPVIPVIIGGFHFLISGLVLAGFTVASPIPITWHWLLAPALLLPFIFCLTGICWLLSAIGVYFRDMEQMMPAMTSALMFLSPVFYSIQVLPEFIRPWLMANPMTLMIETLRNLLFWQQLPAFTVLAGLYVFALLVFYLGYSCFTVLRRGFSDVL